MFMVFWYAIFAIFYTNICYIDILLIDLLVYYIEDAFLV